MKHEHEWAISYSLKIGDKVTVAYICPCGERKEEVVDKVPRVERASNRGGEFSTNWKPWNLGTAIHASNSTYQLSVWFAMTSPPSSGRTSASEWAYQEAKKNGGTIPLAEEPALISYKFWKLIANRFPYDAIFSTHDMLLPVRKFSTRDEMTREEERELDNVIKGLSSHYHLLFENFSSRRSVSDHFHIHLAVYKSRSDSGFWTWYAKNHVLQETFAYLRHKDLRLLWRGASGGQPAPCVQMVWWAPKEGFILPLSML